MATTTRTLSADAAAIDYHPAQAWIVCLTAALFFFYEFVQMSMFNAISADLMATFHIDGAQFGNLSATYFYADVFFLLPAGLIIDRISVKRLILGAMLLCVACTYIFASANHLWVAMVAHGLTGVGSAFCLISCLKLASRWFRPRQLALVTGLVVTIAMIGGMVAQTPMAILAQHFGWRHAMMTNATFGVLLMVVIGLCVKDFPPNYDKKQQEKTNPSVGFWQSIKSAGRNSQVWWAGLYVSLINLPIFLLGQTWGALYLQQVHGFSEDHASNITSMLFLGIIFGSPAFGWFSDKLGLRKRPMIIGAILNIVTLIGIMYIPNPSYGELLGLFLVLGFFNGCQIIGYPVVTESCRLAITATALGIASTMIMLGGTTEPIFGWVLDLGWHGTMAHGVQVYSAVNYLHAMWLMPIACMLGLACAMATKETHCRLSKDN